LSEFRDRLRTHQVEQRLLDHMLQVLREHGLLKARGKMRTDSTHVLAAIRVLQRLETIAETLRQALNHLAVVAPSWLRAMVDPTWYDRYAERIESYRLPKDEAKRHELALIFAFDGYRLLDAIYHPTALAWLRELPAVETLRQVWIQQFYRSDLEEQSVRWRGKDEQPPSAITISSPYDPEARCCIKRDTTWVGYRVHLTERCDDDAPHVITHVVTTLATTSDNEMTTSIHTDLAAKDILPKEHLVDTGYIDAELLVSSVQQHAVTLLGPVMPDTSWQAKAEQGFSVAQFSIDPQPQQVHCPQGKVSRQWIAGTDANDNPCIRIAFHRQDCQVCPCRQQCTSAKVGARSLTIRPREQHEAIQAARARQQTAEFKEQYAKRAGVEGTISQAARRCDLRRTRYIGLAKTGLQHIVMAVALNVVRIGAWLMEQPRAHTRTSQFAALAGAGM
jgi:transposase